MGAPLVTDTTSKKRSLTSTLETVVLFSWTTRVLSTCRTLEGYSSTGS